MVFADVKEQILDRYAELFSTTGPAVLVYDHRYLGSSDGERRQEINPQLQLPVIGTQSAMLKGGGRSRAHRDIGNDLQRRACYRVRCYRQAGRLRGQPGADDQRV